MPQTSKSKSELLIEIRELRNRLIEIDYERTKRIKAEEALKESMENFQAMADNAYDCILIGAEEGNFVYVNKRASEVTGYTEKELLRSSVKEITHTDDVRNSMRNFRRVIEDNGYYQHQQESVLVKKDGTSFPVELTASRTIWQGQPAVIAIVRDITERKAAEEALIESEEKFRTVAEDSPNIIFINNFRNIVYTNKAALKTMGFTREEFYSDDFNFMDIIADEDKEVVWKNFTDQKDGLDVPPHEYGIITKDGRRIESIITTKLITYEGAPAILGIMTDITKLKEEEDLIREREEQLRLAINSLPDAIHVADKDLNIIMVNDRFKKWNRKLGLNGEPEGKSIFDTFPFLPGKITEEYEEVKKSGEALETFEYTDIEGQKIYTQTIKIPIIEKNEVSRIITVIRDISKLKENELAVRESEERFRILTEQNIMGIMILQDGMLKYANSAVSEISELPPDELMALSQEDIFKFIQPEDVDFVRAQAYKKQAGIDKGITTSYKCHIKLRSGKEKVLRVYSKTIQYKGKTADFILLNDQTDIN